MPQVNWDNHAGSAQLDCDVSPSPQYVPKRVYASVRVGDMIVNSFEQLLESLQKTPALEGR
jgi:hypothetical protein